MISNRLLLIIYTSSILLLISGCSKDDNNTIAHTPPFCSFLDPSDNAKFTQGVEITLEARTEGRDSDLSIERFLINDEVVYEINSSINGWFTYDWQTNDETPGLYEIRFQAIDSAEAISEDTLLIELLAADTIGDIDGNRYRTIQIGDQTWMAENLKTTSYKDGTPIELITNNNNWSEDSTGAYCWYNNDEENGKIYGALYNYYAVETNKICPDGWHVPTNEEWNTLEATLLDDGFSDLNGNALKADSVWGGVEDIWGFDYYGFKALPGGQRSALSGYSHNIESSGTWWSSTSVNDNAYTRNLSNNYNMISGQNTPKLKKFGYSIRCIKD